MIAVSGLLCGVMNLKEQSLILISGAMKQAAVITMRNSTIQRIMFQ